MITVSTIAKLRQVIKNWRSLGESIAFVPTMGNLHQGHLQLATAAKQRADRLVVSIFVNPTQFGVGEDFQNYPRTEDEDARKLTEIGADLLFLPEVAEIYPNENSTMVSVPDLSSILCGAFRPGHFTGVATVVCKLLNIVQPDHVFFGLKDFQQLTIIKTMVSDLNLPVEISAVDTVREADGLALSSRNSYLDDHERKQAPLLYRTLCEARDDVLSDREASEIERQAIALLENSGFTVDYFSVCRQSDLKKAELADQDLVILAAARLGKTRLIDNIRFTREGGH